MTSELDRLKQEYIDHITCGRSEEAARTLAKRDELLLSELCNATDLALLFDVSPSAVSNWTSRHPDFPAPRIGKGRTARYSRTEVIQWWAKRHPRLAEALREVEDR